jgi:hypothetical protein
MVLLLLLLNICSQIEDKLMSGIGSRLVLSIPHENLLLVPGTTISCAMNAPIPSNHSDFRIPLANEGKAAPPSHA